LPKAYILLAEAELTQTASRQQVQHRAYTIYLQEVLAGQSDNINREGLSLEETNSLTNGFIEHIANLKSSSPVLLIQPKQGGDPQPTEEHNYEKDDIDEMVQDEDDNDNKVDDSNKSTQLAQPQGGSIFIDLANTSSSSDSSSSSESQPKNSVEEEKSNSKRGDQKEMSNVVAGDDSLRIHIGGGFRGAISSPATEPLRKLVDKVSDGKDNKRIVRDQTPHKPSNGDMEVDNDGKEEENDSAQDNHEYQRGDNNDGDHDMGGDQDNNVGDHDMGGDQDSDGDENDKQNNRKQGHKEEDIDDEDSDEDHYGSPFAPQAAMIVTHARTRTSFVQSRQLNSTYL
jgi:hypothetical protein